MAVLAAHAIGFFVLTGVFVVLWTWTNPNRWIKRVELETLGSTCVYLGLGFGLALVLQVLLGP